MTDSGQPPGRAALGMRQMIGALVVLLVIVGVVATVTRGCSFDPGAPATDPSSAPSVDVSAKLGEAASAVEFPVREPALPSSWRANSSSTTPVGSGSDVIVRVGWLTPGGRYLQLSQSGGAVGDVVAAETEAGPEVKPTGSASAGGVTWEVYPSRRDEVAWVTELDGAVLLVTGNGTEQEFRELAAAAVAAKPLAR